MRCAERALRAGAVRVTLESMSDAAMTGRRQSFWLCFAASIALSGLAVGCKEGAGGGPAEPPSVCPTCEARVGGETSDFGGEWHPCEAVNGRVEVDAEEAQALGYDVAGLQQRVEREIDTPLRWDAQDTEGGEPATGYEEETRVQASVVVTSYVHVRPDPEFCDGTLCNREGVVDLQQAICAQRLHMMIDVEIKTLDGAIDAMASGEAVQWRAAEQYEQLSDGPAQELQGESAARELHGHVYANLRDVTGTLGLFPDEGEPRLAQYSGGTPAPYPGVLTVQLDFVDGATQGFIWPQISLAVVDEHGDDMTVHYRPLQGRWPADE
jgi:hypothetical protein